MKAWRNWFLIFVPLSAVSLVGSSWFGFAMILPVLLALLVAVLLYQRFINRRSWRSIMWGVRAPEE